MTAFELMTLIQENGSQLESHTMNFVSIYFGVVVAAYFVGDKLPKPVVLGMIIIFSTFTVLNVSAILGIVELNVVLESALRLADGGEVLNDYLTELDAGPAAWIGGVSFLLTYLLGYASAVGFLLYMSFKRDANDPG